MKSTGDLGGSTPDFQAGGGFEVRSLSRYQWKFSKYFNRGSGGSEPTLTVGPTIKRSVTSREEAPCRGANYLGDFWVIFERFVSTDSGRLSKPIKEREYKLIHTYIQLLLHEFL